MKFTQAAAAAILAFCASGVLAAPLPQLAGEGSAANSILSDTDNATGYSVEEIEENTACTISTGKVCTGAKASGGSSAPPPPQRRQLAGEGSAADSILSDTDNASGYAIEDVEENTADTIKSGKLSTGASNGSGGSGSGSSAPPPPPPPQRRQLDKISAGAGDIGDALGAGSVADPVAEAGESADGSLTSAAANAGAAVGSAEESTLEGVASNVPKTRRQLDKISAGAGDIGDALGAGAVADPVASAGETADGDLTSAAANAGAEVGSEEEKTLEGTASQVPKL